MRDPDTHVASVLIGLVIGIAIGGALTQWALRGEAIEHGAARYHPTTGEFEWVGKETEKR